MYVLRVAVVGGKTNKRLYYSNEWPRFGSPISSKVKSRLNKTNDNV